MKQTGELPVSEHERAVERYYDRTTEDFYIGQWNRDHIHFGVFEDGECPEDNEHLPESAGLARATERMIDVTVSPAMLEKSCHVVDAGCGVGGTAIYLAQTIGCSVTGVNVNRKQLDMAGKKVTDAGLDDKVSFKYADCSRTLPFADESIDAVVNIESACHYSNRGQFLREVTRILKPGGRIAAMDWLARDDITSGQYEEYIQPICDSWTLSGLESQTTYTGLVRDAGMVILEFEGFNGKEMGNLQIIENAYRNCTMLWFAGINTPEFRRLLDKFATLYKAWRKGYFELRRYCAQKP